MRRRLEIFLYLLSILVLAATVSYYMIPSRTMHETIYDAIEPSGLTATESTAHKTQERLLYDTEYGNLARGGDACIMAKSFLEGIFSVGGQQEIIGNMWRHPVTFVMARPFSI